MRRNQRIVLTGVWAALVLGMLTLLASGMLNRKPVSGSTPEPALDVLFDAPTFSVTDQNGNTVTNESMHGKVWIASLFFSECAGICPMMTSRLKDLQQTVTSPTVQLISFSVDPEHDTPEVMKKYADKAKADSTRWHFVTGSKEQMFALARGLKLGMEPAHDNQPIIHSQQALLIDGKGHVRGVYDTNDEVSMKRLASDATILAAESDQ